LSKTCPFDHALQSVFNRGGLAFPSESVDVGAEPSVRAETREDELKKNFSHVDGSGKIRMVDVSEKRATRRSATASCVILTTADRSQLSSASSDLDRIHSARLAGIMAAKQTAQLIPLCHPLNLDDIQVDVLINEHGVEIQSSVATVHQTGVEMEALTACAVAALSLLTSLLTVDHSARMDDLVLLRKSGGESGDWGRQVHA